MKLSLSHLYRSMREQGIERYKFNFRFNNFKFEAIYFIDDSPHILSFGIIEHNFYFEVEVRKGFNIGAYIDDINKFRKIMGLQYDENNPFHPSIFYDVFDEQIPQKANKKGIPKPHDIALHRNDVMESEKIYFLGWLDNNKSGKKVQLENLEKTRKLLSYKAYLRCKEKNISSRWSPFSSDEKKFESSF